ncbi:hypothetical protein C1I64_15130 [Rathayibacter festucae DSM 15932]|uniref:Uncharacterized protein n=1 Tax=Rathayibacter festucae DSM 15932 TaxID=1328866 RepID=A0A3Q9UU87_9MICO|nr:hypothetical protein C1I64_15130 [Rathayibacter festucae DSM 15932]
MLVEQRAAGPRIETRRPTCLRWGISICPLRGLLDQHGAPAPVKNRERSSPSMLVEQRAAGPRIETRWPTCLRWWISIRPRCGLLDQHEAPASLKNRERSSPSMLVE